MARWSTTATDDMARISDQVGGAEAENLQREINSWADTVKELARKVYEIGRIYVTATAKNSEVLKVDIDGY